MNRIALTLSILLILLSVSCYQPVADDSDKYGERKPDTPSGSDRGNGSEPETSRTTSDTVTTAPREESMNDKNSNPAGGGFRENVSRNLSRENLRLESVANESSVVEKRVFEEYGAVYLTKAKPPVKAMFTNEAEVLAFQNSANPATSNIGGTAIELQKPAMDALNDAIAAARSAGLTITPRDGKEAGRRSFEKTVSLWHTRFEPALKHWKSKGRLSDSQISNLKSLPVKEQVAAVLELEKDGIFFNTFFNNSILYSVAAPGTSQHLSMLAFDVSEFANKRIQEILAAHGWFRTVQNDAPHFTFLGYKESELPSIGLKKVDKKDGVFWIPSV